MGTLNAFYVRAGTDTVAITDAIRAKFPKAEVETDTHFCGVTMPDEAFAPPERNLLELFRPTQDRRCRVEFPERR